MLILELRYAILRTLIVVLHQHSPILQTAATSKFFKTRRKRVKALSGGFFYVRELAKATISQTLKDNI